MTFSDDRPVQVTGLVCFAGLTVGDLLHFLKEFVQDHPSVAQQPVHLPGGVPLVRIKMDPALNVAELTDTA